MYPILFRLNVQGETKAVTAYGVFAVVGILLAALFIIRLARERGVDSFDMVNIIALLVAGGILFSLLTHFLIFLPDRLRSKSFFDIPAGVVSWGGVVGGFLSALYASRVWKIPLLRLADMTVPGVALGFAFGRVGCHFAGCCFGLHYDGPLALHFTHPLAPAAEQAQPLFPIQLLSALLLLLLALLLWRLLTKNLKPGWVFLAYLLLYGSGRFVAEFYRADARGILFSLSDAQWYSLVLLSATFFLYRHLNAKETTHAD